MTNSATRALHCYQTLLGTAHQGDETVYQRWLRLQQLIKTEWRILESLIDATGAALNPDSDQSESR
ncbi:MAG TPA: hypothetical protein DCZ13_02495 [Porticoccaceae bacterium]|nr:hypothetical protein [Porticoccaceae bacterium]